MKSLLVHGIVEMIVDDEETGSYRVFLFGHCHEKDKDNIYFQRAVYYSKTEKWQVIEVVLVGHGLLSSSKFPGPLQSYRVGNDILCFTATAELFLYSYHRGLMWVTQSW